MKKEVKIALTAIVAVVLFYIGLNFLKGINVFTSTNSYYVKFKDVVGLTVSSPVLANGYAVGIVRDIHYNYAENSDVLVKVELNTNMRVPEGTYAELETSMMGSVTLHLVPGLNPVSFLEPGDTVLGGMRQGMMEKAGEMMPTVMNMLPKVDSIMHNVNRITGDSALLMMVQNLALITTNLQKTTQQLDQMMNHQIPTLMTNVNQVAENLNKITGQVAQSDLQGTMGALQSTMKNAEQLTAQLNLLTSDLNQRISSEDNTLGLLLNNRGLYENLSNTAASADSLLQDMKQRPGRYIHFSVFGKKNK
ncbi:MAG: MCE family protein [Bacteroidaceae bacterium]|nr:MCE family protein [Bacteroidaceae bacterium]